MTNVFISYRRDDAGDTAGRIADRLRALPQVDDVFLDVESISYGEDFIDKINHVISECEYCLLLMGPRWDGPRDGQLSRIMEDDDFVRMEARAVLTSNIKVIPILLRDAPMPSAENLPSELAELTRRNAFPLRTSFFAQDIEILFDDMFGKGRARPGQSMVSKIGRLLTGGLIGGLIGGALLIAFAFALKLATGNSMSALFGYNREATALVMLAVPVVGFAIGAWFRRH